MSKARIAAIVGGALLLALLLLWSARRDANGAAIAAKAEQAATESAVRAPTRVGPSASNIASISGRVRTISGEPLTGASVCAVCAACDLIRVRNEASCVRTEADGRYALRELPERSYFVSATADGYQPGAAAAAQPLQLSDRELAGQDIVLEPGGAQISGVVSDASGGTVAGATVLAHFALEGLAPSRMLSQMVVTNDDGAFAMSVPAGVVTVVGYAEGYSVTRQPGIAPARGLHVVLTPEASISGFVLSHPDRVPVAGVEVHARSLGSYAIATSDHEGAFALKGLRPGAYSIEAWGRGYRGRVSGMVSVEVSDVAANLVVPVTAGTRVAGAIRVGETPCVSGTAELVPEPGEQLPRLSAVTDLTGAVELDAVPPGRYQTLATCDGYGTKSGAPLVVADTELTGLSWSFEPGVRVTVHVRTPEGVPVVRAWVELIPVAGKDGSSAPATAARMVQSDRVGDAEFIGVIDGAYQLIAPELADPQDITIATRRGPLELELVTRPAGTIEVVVRDRSGLVQDGLGISSKSKEGHPPEVAERRGDGVYVIGPLRAGEYQVEVRDHVNPLLLLPDAEGWLQVRSGEVTKIEATYGGHGGRITGRVVDARGAAVQDAWVTALPPSAEDDRMRATLPPFEEPRALTDAEGRFAIEGLLEPGSSTILAEHRKAGHTRVDGVVVGGRVELTLRAPGHVSGRMLTSTGDPARSFRIMIVNQEAKQHLFAEFGPQTEGHWSVPDIAAGKIQITAQVSDESITVERELAPGGHIDALELRAVAQPVAQK
jgi:hypothetical protein